MAPTYIRRRARWKLADQAAEIDFGSRDKPEPSRLRWALVRKPPKKPRLLTDPEEKSWHLYWDGILLEEFKDLTLLKIWVLYFVYSIEQNYCIPSAILWDSGLYYKDGKWIDDWYVPSVSFSEIGELPYPIPEGIFPADPQKMRILLENQTHDAKPLQRSSLPERSPQFLRLHRGINGERKLLSVAAPAPQPTRIGNFRPISLDWEDPNPWSRVSLFQKFFWSRDRLKDEDCVYRFELPKCEHAVVLSPADSLTGVSLSTNSLTGAGLSARELEAGEEEAAKSEDLTD